MGWWLMARIRYVAGVNPLSGLIAGVVYRRFRATELFRRYVRPRRES